MVTYLLRAYAIDKKTLLLYRSEELNFFIKNIQQKEQMDGKIKIYLVIFLKI